MEIADTIKNLPKGKATGEDNIPAEFFQYCVICIIYVNGKLLDDFLSNIFIPIRKFFECNEV